MTLKKTLPAMTLMLALIFAVSVATAQTPEQGENKEPKKISKMNPEDRAAWEALMKEYRQKTEPMRDQMWAKNLEYDALVANPNTKPAEVKAVIDEMLRLKVQLRTEHEKFAETAKAKGLKGFKGHGFGRDFHKGWRGHGPERGFDAGDCPGQGKGFGKGHGKGKGRHHGEGRPQMDAPMND